MKKPESIQNLKSLTVKSTAEAWGKANELFATDYQQDYTLTERAGYPVYHSTVVGEWSWISDLGDRLEINFAEGPNYSESFNIWIDNRAEVAEAEVKRLKHEIKNLEYNLKSAENQISWLRGQLKREKHLNTALSNEVDFLLQEREANEEVE